MAGEPLDLVAVYIVTYRRHHMLRRAIKSVLAQTHDRIRVKVVNDDPADAEVSNIIAGFGDPRLSLFEPMKNRGATRNFNLVFQEREAAFTTLLEDDNWWQPQFIERQLAVLKAHPDAPLVVGNERVWTERPGDHWHDTGRDIWPFHDVRLHHRTLVDLCGRTVLANSSLMVRVDRAAELLVPDTIPVDVTEHFRDRLLLGAFPLNGEVLVNYAETLHTARRQDDTWGLYQIMLIGSVFAALPVGKARTDLARALWATVPSAMSPRAISMLSAGLFVSEARALVKTAPLLARARGLAHHVKNWNKAAQMRRALAERQSEFAFLHAAAAKHIKGFVAQIH